MKKFFFLGLVLAQLAGTAADNNAELLCVWNYKTHYQSPRIDDLPQQIVYTEGESYFFFSDHTYVKADIDTDAAELEALKASNSGRWLTSGNNLVLLDHSGKQQLAVVGKSGQSVSELIKGEKEISRTVTIGPGVLPQVYQETVAFFPQ